MTDFLSSGLSVGGQEDVAYIDALVSEGSLSAPGASSDVDPLAGDVRHRFTLLAGRGPSDAEFWPLYAIAQQYGLEAIDPHVKSTLAGEAADAATRASVESQFRAIAGYDVPEGQFWPLFALAQQGENLDPHIRAYLAGVTPVGTVAPETVMSTTLAPVSRPLFSLIPATAASSSSTRPVARPGWLLPVGIAAALWFLLD